MKMEGRDIADRLAWEGQEDFVALSTSDDIQNFDGIVICLGFAWTNGPPPGGWCSDPGDLGA